ncbi:HYC_CC_PP family protein [Tenacibaculum finnmarkense]|nr:hypothetical protein [Tenacibaculum finnmarkense]
MKKISHKIMSVLMALVVLFATMSFTIDMHFCGDTLIDTAVFHKVKSCGMKMQKSATKGCSITKKNCCNDTQIAVDAQDELQITVDSISFEQQVFISSFVYSYSLLFKTVNNNIPFYTAYKPLLVIKQLYKIDETYLI